MLWCAPLLFFFFSSRRRHTRSDRDWSSDVCSSDLPATNAQLDGPEGVAVDSAGNVYIAEHWNHLVRKVDQAGIITTVAGNRYSSATGDNIPATQSWLTAPLGVAVDASGTLLITDGTRLRSVSGGVITTGPGSSAVEMASP